MTGWKPTTPGSRSRWSCSAGQPGGYAANGSELDRANVAIALSALAEPLLPHLRGEEDDAMPLVSATLTDAEWRARDQQHNVRGKSLSRLAAEGHWLMDGLDPDRRDVLLLQRGSLDAARCLARAHGRAAGFAWRPLAHAHAGCSAAVT